VGVRSKEYVWGHSITGIAGSNPADGKDVRLFFSLCGVLVVASATSRSLVQRNLTSCVSACVCVCVCVSNYVI
jgi:hypothetical protein